MTQFMQTWGPLAFAALPFFAALVVILAAKLKGTHPHAAEALEVMGEFLVDVGHGDRVVAAAQKVGASPGAKQLIADVIADAKAP